MTIANLVFLGTGHHRDTHHTLLKDSYEQINKAGVADVSARLFDGVGCKGTTEHPTPGQYIVLEDKKIPVPPSLGFKGLARLNGILFAEGTDSLIVEALSYIADLTAKNNGIAPEVINLQGFSRGADTCVRLANVLNTLGIKSRVNLFLVDQVPGSFRRDDAESYIIPANVDNFTAHLMLNEHKPVFKEQHLGRYVFAKPTKTKVSFHTHAGVHGEGISIHHWGSKSSSWSETSHPSYDLIQDDLRNFNIEHAKLNRENRITKEFHRDLKTNTYSITELNSSKESLSDQERFALCCAAMDLYTKRNERFISKTPLFHQRTVSNRREDYVKNSNLFISQQHRELFKTVYPDLFCWFFENNYKEIPPETIEEQLKAVKQSDDKLKSFFSALQKNFNGPCGLNTAEAPKLGQPLITDELSNLVYLLRSTVNYRIIENAVRGICMLSNFFAMLVLNYLQLLLTQAPHMIQAHHLRWW